MSSPPPSLRGDVKLPGIGKVPRKTVVIWGSAIVGVAALAYYRHRRGQSINPTVPADDTGATGDDLTSSGTGYSGYADDAGYSSSGGSPTNGSLFGSGYSGSGPSESVDTTTTVSRPQYNDQWSQSAQDYLVNSVGLEAAVVSKALGAYLSGEAIDDAGRSVVQQAIAAVGQPPQSGPQGYPPSIRHAATAPVQKQLATPAIRLVGGLVNNQQQITWPTVPGAKTYQIWVSDLGMTAEISATGGMFNAGPANRTLYIVARNIAGGYKDSAKSNSVRIPPRTAGPVGKVPTATVPKTTPVKAPVPVHK